MQGDWNEKVGKDACGNWQGICGPFCNDDTNERGLRLLESQTSDLCDRRRELRKERFELEGSKKYREVNNNIKRCMKKAKGNWIAEQSSETEENLRKNDSKRAYQHVKDFDHCERRKS